MPGVFSECSLVNVTWIWSSVTITAALVSVLYTKVYIVNSEQVSEWVISDTALVVSFFSFLNQEHGPFFQ